MIHQARVKFNFAFAIFWGLYGMFAFWLMAQLWAWLRKVGLL